MAKRRNSIQVIKEVLANSISHQRNSPLITVVLVLVELVMDIIIHARLTGIMPKEEIDCKHHRRLLTSIHRTSIMDLLLFMEAPLDFTHRTRVLHLTARFIVITMRLPWLMVEAV